VSANQAFELVRPDLLTLSPNRREQIELIWSVALETGGPLVPAISRFAEVLGKLDAHQAQLQLTFASPKATSKLIFGLPFIGLGLAQLLGLAPISAMTTSLPGFLALCLGLILMLIASISSRRMLRRASPEFSDPGIFLDCVIIGLQAGLPVSAAVANAKGQVGLGPDGESSSRLEQALVLSDSTGAELTGILSAAADGLRDELFHDQSNRLAKLAVHLMIPLGLAVLPAFVLLTVVPIAIGLLGK
jgi:tight adherence protein B